MSPSSVTSHVSEVDVCAGMMRREMKKALLIRAPARMPQVSRFRRVFGLARERKALRRAVGRKRVRRGRPPSVLALGAKV